jgi:predicted lysophospholipase L1 biosynthesis ABC-type transport system permease subunit
VNQPSRRDRLKPVELIVLSAVMGLFVGLVVLLSTRELVLSAIFFGVAFIVALVVMAMFALSIKPNELERHEIDGDEGSTPPPPSNPH